MSFDLDNTADVVDIAALRGLIGEKSDVGKAFVASIGWFDWLPTSTDADNGATVIKPDDVSAIDPGRWVKVSGAGVTWSRQILVDAVAGSDSNDGVTLPVKTLLVAHTKAGNGNTIVVAEGDYSAQAPLDISKQNVTVIGHAAGPGGVKTTAPAITGSGLGPKLANLKLASLTLTHPASNGAHTSGVQVTGTTFVNSPSFWEDHGSKFVGDVTLAGAGAKYLYGSQFEGNVTTTNNSGAVALIDCIGDGASVLTISAGTVYALRNCSGFIHNISASAISAIDAAKALGMTEAQAQSAVATVFDGLRVNGGGLHLASRLTYSEVSIPDKTVDYTVPSATLDRAAGLVFAQTTADVEITLNDPSDTSSARLLVLRNSGTADLTVNAQTVAAGSMSLWGWAWAAWHQLSGGAGGGLASWALAEAVSAGAKRVKDSVVWVANGAIPANTAFAVGTTGATWAAYIGDYVNWSLAEAVYAGAKRVRGGTVWVANGAIPANTAFATGTTGATWSVYDGGNPTVTYQVAATPKPANAKSGDVMVVSSTGDATGLLSAFEIFDGATWSRIPTGAASSIASAVTITGTTTNPTKGATRVVDSINVIDDGSGWCDLVMNYHQSTAGTAGSGDYLVTLPAGYTFDTAFHGARAVTGDPVLNSPWAWIPGARGKLFSPGANVMQSAHAMVWDATRFRVLLGAEGLYSSHGAIRSPWSPGLFTMSDGCGVQIAFRFKKG